MVSKSNSSWPFLSLRICVARKRAISSAGPIIWTSLSIQFDIVKFHCIGRRRNCLPHLDRYASRSSDCNNHLHRFRRKNELPRLAGRVRARQTRPLQFAVCRCGCLHAARRQTSMRWLSGLRRRYATLFQTPRSSSDHDRRWIERQVARLGLGRLVKPLPNYEAANGWWMLAFPMP